MRVRMIFWYKIQFNKYLNTEKELNNHFEINFCANFIVETFKNEINGVLLDYTSSVHMFINIKKEILDGFPKYYNHCCKTGSAPSISPTRLPSSTPSKYPWITTIKSNIQV